MSQALMRTHCTCNLAVLISICSPKTASGMGLWGYGIMGLWGYGVMGLWGYACFNTLAIITGMSTCCRTSVVVLVSSSSG